MHRAQIGTNTRRIMVAKPQNRQIHRPSQTGLSLLETMIALTILLIATIGLLSIGMMATSTTENRGHPTAPSTGYVDYLDGSGNLLTIVGGVAPSNWYYIRVWQISSPATNIKQITVTAKVKMQVGAPQGALPQSTLSILKTSPF